MHWCSQQVYSRLQGPRITRNSRLGTICSQVEFVYQMALQARTRKAFDKLDLAIGLELLFQHAIKLGVELAIELAIGLVDSIPLHGNFKVRGHLGPIWLDLPRMVRWVARCAGTFMFRSGLR